MKRSLKITLSIIIGCIIIGGVTTGIWLGIRNNNQEQEHPEPEWSLLITGNLTNISSMNITMEELLAMLSFEKEYLIRGSDTYNAVFKGISLNYLLENVITIDEEATTVRFIAYDEYSINMALSKLLANEEIILAYEKEGEFLKPASEGGIGYLRLIDPPVDEGDYNGPRCLKNIVELEIS
jgi:hypothetical protein